MKTIRKILFVMLAAVLFLSAAFTTAGAAEENGKPLGRFEDNKGNWFNIGGAYAFPGRVGLDDEPGIIVAISNSTFNTENIDRLWDRKSFINKYFMDEETVVAFLQFSMKGKYEGVSYNLGSGSNCGICYDSKTKSTVRISGDRIAGSISYKVKDESYNFEVTFDVPVAPHVPGKEISGGGEPWKVYSAFHKALRAQKEGEIKKLVVRDIREGIEKAGKENKKKGPNPYIESLNSEHPEEIKLVRAFEKKDGATLLLTNNSKDMLSHGEVLMKKEGGKWLFYIENFYFGDWPEGMKP